MKLVKKFLEWIKLKEKLHLKEHKPPLFNDGEVWWCAMGENVGIEINGKGVAFSRPVYVYKKLSREGFLGIPLSTSLKKGTWYVEVSFQGRNSVANLAQCRVFSFQRMYEKMGALDDSDRGRIKDGFIALYS